MAKSEIPEHVAVIMDGNGRWASNNGLPRIQGHRAGLENIDRVIIAFRDAGVKYATFYTFSTENWSRPEQEVEGLIELLYDSLTRNIDFLIKEGIRLTHLGRTENLPQHVVNLISKTIESTKNNSRITVSIAFDYGGRHEILRAVKLLIQQGLHAKDITEKVFGSNLYTKELPDPDLIIRTGGEMRLSNFLIWQSAYSEFYTSPVLWPDFGPPEVESAISEYKSRDRRFGGI
tara:strand:- start:1870 stop:2565 length:696 start_codon:yes stop_codon:yes gene_type:complete